METKPLSNLPSPSRLLGSITIKLITIAVLLLFLLVPIILLTELISERRERKVEAVAAIQKSWASRQFVSGLVLQVPYTEISRNDITRDPLSTLYYQLSDTLNIHGTLAPEERYRGIFRTTVYTSSVHIKGTLRIPKLTSYIQGTEYRPVLEQACLHLPLADSRGLAGIDIKINGKPYDAEVSTLDGVISSLRVKFPLVEGATDLVYEITLKLNGSEGLDFLPLARSTTASVEAPWGSPSYEGAFLPVSKELEPTRFKGSWNVLYLNRNLPQSWMGSVPRTDRDVEVPDGYTTGVAYSGSGLIADAFGVRLEESRDTYDTTERSTKYAMLIILLTFVAFFLIEVLHKRRIHPIQYLMVAAGLGLFYLLLLSLAEHIAFQWAYLIAGFAIITTLSGYIQAMFRETRFTLFISSGLTFLYAFFYVLLQSEDHALLLGSLGLLGALALAMYTTRNVDWYSLNK